MLEAKFDFVDCQLSSNVPPITTFSCRATVVPPDSDVGREYFLVLSPPPSLPRHMQSLRHEEAYRADIGTALKFLVAIDKLKHS
jgi:hypothetical protein